MLNFFKNLNPLAFFISFALGIFICYIKAPAKRVVYRHPTPKNAGKIIYHDDNDKCFKYKYNEVKCPKDKSLISEHPVVIA